MDYNLAKQLKDAGFPQVQPHSSSLDFGDCTNPTLSELIEACGESFLALQHTSFHPVMPIPKESMPKEWAAMGGENVGTHFSYQQHGYAPEEAVARLWLALHLL
jgi:hypothetical protein